MTNAKAIGQADNPNYKFLNLFGGVSHAFCILLLHMWHGSRPVRNVSTNVYFKLHSVPGIACVLVTCTPQTDKAKSSKLLPAVCVLILLARTLLNQVIFMPRTRFNRTGGGAAHSYL